jgi:hypothetical protein
MDDAIIIGKAAITHKVFCMNFIVVFSFLVIIVNSGTVNRIGRRDDPRIYIYNSNEASTAPEITVKLG